MRTTTLTISVAATLAAVLVLAACAPGPDPLTGSASAGGTIAGFALGLWHGFIIWVTFIVSLFDHSVSVYEVHNNGWPYNLGFAIGAATLHGGGAHAARRRRRR